MERAMTLYIGWWPVIGAVVPFMTGLLFFVYFYLWHFPFVMMRRSSETVRESTRPWENWMMFYDSAGMTDVYVSRYDVVNNVLSMVNLAFQFSLGQTGWMMVRLFLLGLIAENGYRYFFV